MLIAATSATHPRTEPPEQLRPTGNKLFIKNLSIFKLMHYRSNDIVRPIQLNGVQRLGLMLLTLAVLKS